MNEPEGPVRTMFRNIMNATQENRYLDFIREGNWAFKIGINVLMFRSVAPPSPKVPTSRR